LRADGAVLPGVEEELNTKLMTYVDSYEGVLLAYRDLELLDHAGFILEDKPFINFRVRATLTLFAPKKGDFLIGEVSRSTRDHVGILVAGVFNATIAADQMSPLYSYQPASESWTKGPSPADKAGKKRKREGAAVIKRGEFVRFEVASVEHEGKVYRLTASLRDAARTGPVSALPAELAADCPSTSMLDEVERLNRNALAPEPEDGEGEGDGETHTAGSLYDYSVFGSGAGAGTEADVEAEERLGRGSVTAAPRAETAETTGGGGDGKKTKAQRTQEKKAKKEAEKAAKRARWEAKQAEQQGSEESAEAGTAPAGKKRKTGKV